jgi:hypothetical protein
MGVFSKRLRPVRSRSSRRARLIASAIAGFGLVVAGIWPPGLILLLPAGQLRRKSRKVPDGRKGGLRHKPKPMPENIGHEVRALSWTAPDEPDVGLYVSRGVSRVRNIHKQWSALHRRSEPDSFFRLPFAYTGLGSKRSMEPVPVVSRRGRGRLCTLVRISRSLPQMPEGLIRVSRCQTSNAPSHATRAAPSRPPPASPPAAILTTTTATGPKCPS